MNVKHISYIIIASVNDSEPVVDDGSRPASLAALSDEYCPIGYRYVALQ